MPKPRSCRGLSIMRIGAAALLGASAVLSAAYAQESEQQTPTIKDLDFLIGEWDVVFTNYNARSPDNEMTTTEEGVHKCGYGLEQNGASTHIICSGELSNNRGGKRTYQSYFRYNRYYNAFERIAVFSGWHATGNSQVFFHPQTRSLELRGIAMLPNGVVERYEDIFVFSDDFNSFTRSGVENWSNMPVTEFRRAFTGGGTKREN